MFNQLKLSNLAWKKVKFFSKLADHNEVGGFMITPTHPLEVEDVALVKQEVSGAHIDFDDDGLAAYRHEMTDRGLEPWQYERIWWHTHPGFSSNPSAVDEDTFKEIFAKPSWAIMFILAKDDDTYIRMKNVAPLDADATELMTTEHMLKLVLQSDELDPDQAQISRDLFNELVTVPSKTYYGSKPVLHWIDGKPYECETKWVKGVSHRTIPFQDGTEKTFICKWDSTLQGYVVDLDRHPELKKLQKKTSLPNEKENGDALYEGYSKAELQDLLIEAYMSEDEKLKDFALQGLKLDDNKHIDHDYMLYDHLY